jgi:glycerophosphoryl diester phosphodiesterase
MSVWGDCVQKRIKACTQRGTKWEERCIEERDLGYERCLEERDEGYRKCCDWWPCSWACKIVVWVSNIVCVVSEWVQNIVCVLTTWVEQAVCYAWKVITFPICAIPGVGPIAIRFLDGGFDRLGEIGRSIATGTINAIAHPFRFAGTVISYFRGCPDERYNVEIPVQIISHHGYTKQYPENTLQSCRIAVEKGATALEIDVCYTKDGHAVLWHDWDPDDAVTVLRPASAYRVDGPVLGSYYRKPVIELTLEELRGHYHYVVDDAVAGVRAGVETGGRIDTEIPTIESFFADVAGWRTAPSVVYLDVKMPAVSVAHAAQMTDKIIDAISAAAPLRFDVIAMVPDQLVLAVMKARAAARQAALRFTWDIEFPPGPILNPWRYSAIDHATGSFHNTVASVGRPVGFIFPWRTYRRVIEYDIGKWRLVNSEPGKYNDGKKVDWLVAWTINERDEMECLASMGVSGIITDEIELLIAVAQSAGRR